MVARTNEIGLSVHGLKEFRSEMRKALADQPKAMNEVNHAVAQFVVDRSAKTARAQSGHRTQAGNPISVAAFVRVHASMTASKAASRSSVRIGGARYPDTLGWEYGAKGKRQFAPWRGNQWVDAGFGHGGPGYVVHPTIREHREQIIEMYGDMLDELAARAFPD